MLIGVSLTAISVEFRTQRESVNSETTYDITGLCTKKALIAFVLCVALINSFFD